MDLLRFACQMQSALADIFLLHLVTSSRSVFALLEHYGVISYKVKKSSHGSAELVIFEFCYEDLRYCSGVDNESVQICGGNECIRSSTACHLIIPFKGSYVCGGHHDTYRYNSYEQANSIKKCLLPTSRQRFGLRIP